MKTLEPVIALSLKNILLATDFSPGSETALKYTQAIARRHASRVHTIHVNSPDSYSLLEPDAFDITFNSSEANPKNVSDVLRGLLTGLPSQTPLRQGAVWEVISDVVKRNEIDLLVLASHGRHGIPRLVLGSVAEDVFRNVSCPVLTVGPDVKPCNNRELKIKKVLLATHFEAGSAAPAHAAMLCNEFDAELTILHVADENKYPVGSKNSRELAQQLASMVPPEACLWRKPVCALKYGLPSANILETAQQMHADLIVLGARHPEPAKINSHLPWATAARVIAEAECPVLTVRQKDSMSSKSDPAVELAGDSVLDHEYSCQKYGTRIQLDSYIADIVSDDEEHPAMHHCIVQRAGSPKVSIWGRKTHSRPLWNLVIAILKSWLERARKKSPRFMNSRRRNQSKSYCAALSSTRTFQRSSAPVITA